MKRLKKIALAAAIASAAAIPLTAQATLTFDGVSFNPGDQLITTAIWESVLANVTDTLSGVGIVSKISCTGCGGTTWLDGNNNTQLTYYFSGYSVAQWYDAGGVAHTSDDNVGFSSAKAIDFTGGSIKLYTDKVTGGLSYLDPAANPNAIDPTLAAIDIANATDGNLWLEYAGATTTDVSGRVGTLFSDAATLNPVHAGGSGFGYLNVVNNPLALATSNFDTDSFNIGGVITDARLDSSFSTPNSGAWPLSGTAAIKTNAIPEPGSLALLGLGLAGLAGLQRRRSQAK